MFFQNLMYKAFNEINHNICITLMISHNQKKRIALFFITLFFSSTCYITFLGMTSNFNLKSIRFKHGLLVFEC